MKTTPPALKRLLDLLDRRLKKSRPASVLILVVALLVLMALIGTAFITTSSTDRYSAAQHAVNTEIDMLVEGVVAMCEGSILKDLTAGQQYRSSPHGHEPVDHSERDRWLAARLPELPPGAPAGSLEPVWPFTSGSPIESAPIPPATALPPEFEMPWSGQGQGRNAGPGVNTLPDTPYHRARQNLMPTWVRVPQPAGEAKLFPALLTPADPALPPEQRLKTFLAADTDGDGIADASYFRLGTGQVNGVTYYAAVRIIDNAAAVNASIALKLNTEPLETNNPALLRGDFFPANIDLLNLLVSSQGQAVQYPPQPNGPQYQQLEQLNNYRYTGNTGGRRQIPLASLPQQVIGADGTPRADFGFASAYEEQWFMLGSRLGNPGRHPGGTFHELSVTEQQNLADGFCVGLSASTSSVLQRVMAGSLGARTVPYQPDDVRNWYAQNFRYDNGAGALLQMPIRPLLVTRNPTGNWVPDVLMRYSTGAGTRVVKKFTYKGPWVGGVQYEMGDWVTLTTPQAPGTASADGWPAVQAFMCIRDNAGTNPTLPSGAWARMPWTSSPAKLNLNTATFGQLYAYYYAVMKDANAVYPHQGPSPTDPPPQDGGGPFRNPLYRTPPPGGDALSAWQMAQVRAALAAVNTIDLRDLDQEVTSRSLTLLERPKGNPQFYVDVYGCEPQPYITEVLVHAYSDGRAYLAIELYNPFSVDINLTGWKLAIADRVDVMTTGMKLREVEDLTSIQATVIRAGEKLVIESSAHQPNDLAYISSPPQNRGQQGPAKRSDGLQDIIATGASEMLLMRPRRPGGVLTESAPNVKENEFSEIANRLVDFVPVDQLDFQGIRLSPVDPMTFQPIDRRYHYARGDKNPTMYGHWVWPGRYDPAGNWPPTPSEDQGLGAKQGLRHEGWRLDPGKAPGAYSAAAGYFPGGIWEPKDAFDPMFAQNRGHATYATQAVHLTSRDTPGPFPGQGRFPFGGFSRAGDVMHVPFIGGYRIRTVDNAAQDPKTFVETHAVTMDSIRADDANNGDAIKPPDEQIGRFVPIDMLNDLLVPADRPNKPRYSWANDVLDLFTAMGPQDDFLPNVDPYFAGDPTVNGSMPKWSARPQEVANGPVSNWKEANWGREDAAAYDGRINVNTAHWRVLATVPMFPFRGHTGYTVPGMGTVTWFQANAALAKAIVHFRDVDDGIAPPGGHGPFRSLWELNRVYDVVNNNTTLTFQNGWGTIDINADLDDDDGDISPVGQGATDNLPGGYESRYVMVNRVSNLLTTQSDSFTVYVTVQGWRGAGTDTPELVAVRRAAAIIDRSVVHPRRPGVAPATGMPPDPERNPVNTTSLKIIPIPLQQ